MTPPTIDEAAFDAAYDALIPHVRHAQVRAAIAEQAASMLGSHHPDAVVALLWLNQPAGTTRLSRTVLAEAVVAAHNATERNQP